MSHFSLCGGVTGENRVFKNPMQIRANPRSESGGFDRPSGTGRVSLSIPGTSYRATFAASLRDRSLSNRQWL